MKPTLLPVSQNSAGTLVLTPSLLSFWPMPQIFEAIMATEGTVYRQIKNRTTRYFTCAGEGYFIKQHERLGWRELFKNIFSGRLPTIGAKSEYEALLCLSALNLSVPILAGYGETKGIGVNRRSFLITQAVSYLFTLDELESAWRENNLSFTFKQLLIKQLADFMRSCHEAGINHRDFYACHVLLKPGEDPRVLALTVIDWHRAQVRQITPERWKMKDVASLYYSVLNFRLTTRDCYRFMAYYTVKPWQKTVKEDAVFWRRVLKRTAQFMKRHTQFFSTPLSSDIDIALKQRRRKQ